MSKNDASEKKISAKPMILSGSCDNMKKTCTQKKSGYTLIEVIISIFIFLIVILGVIQIFVSQVNAYKHARSVQNDVENAQFAMNYIAKTLRTSSILGVTITGDNDFDLEEIPSGNPLIVYDFSQELCMRFEFKDKDYKGYAEKALWVYTVSGVQYDNIRDVDGGCADNDIYNGANAQEHRLTTGSVTGKFQVAPTRFDEEAFSGSRVTKTIGKATISLVVAPGETGIFQRGDAAKPINLQTTVSLRDYPSDLSF